VRFDFSGASFTTEDAGDGTEEDTAPSASTERPVGIGTMVSVSFGDFRNDGVDDLAAATRVTLISAIRGPLDAITTSGSQTTLTVLGQAVDVDAGTWYTPGFELANLVANRDKVVVYADLVAGRYKATRVEYRPNMVVYKVRGLVANLNTTNRTFDLGGITINYNSAVGSNVTLTDGQLVRVRILASATPTGTTYPARLVAPISTSLSNNQQLRVAGAATAVNLTQKTCKVDGTTVDLSLIATTDLANLANNSRLEIKGTVQNGVLVATQISVKSEAEVEAEHAKVKLIGAIQNYASTAGGASFTLKGITVNVVNGSTEISSANGGNTTLASGRTVEVEGERTAIEPITITATRIRVR
jgi:hypothetical protein